ncbi:hypothetical protein [Rhodoferax ferrireducens]|uniref:hypothetical protein n=1 Tax=Rhodoferax ferrireducens TaxID=192843 RepID=UPI000E0D8610|nr:hypothetical protein [Rhodoferax ferrireducens]
MTIKTINLKSIRIDGGTQARVCINNDLVAEYAQAMQGGVQFPNSEVFFDGVDYWLADGFHRLHAMLTLGKASAAVMVFNGTLRDAILHSLAVNNDHGLRKSNEDKRKSVQTMLDDAEWSKLSDREIAKHCGCTHPLVGAMRNPKPATQAPAAAPSGSSSTSTPDLGAQKLGTAGSSTTAAAKPAPAKTQAQEQAEQNAMDAHGDLDPIEMLEAAEKQVATLQQELFALQADDQKAETLKFKRIADTAVRRQDELMETVNAREKELQRQANWLRRIGAALGEEDHSKLAARVEALARTAKV